MSVADDATQDCPPAADDICSCAFCEEDKANNGTVQLNEARKQVCKFYPVLRKWAGQHEAWLREMEASEEEALEET